MCQPTYNAYGNFPQMPAQNYNSSTAVPNYGQTSESIPPNISTTDSNDDLGFDPITT
jgi:hypothetical protein